MPNDRALELAFDVCRQAFPGVSPSEWEPGRVSAPRSLSYACIDLRHRTHVMNLLGAETTSADPYTPFVRVVNSFNGMRALRFDFGFMRRHCSNGVVFEKDVASVKASHDARGLDRLKVEVGTIDLNAKWAEFARFVSVIRGLELTVQDAQRVTAALLRLPKADAGSSERRREECADLQADVAERLSRYRDELGGNAYSVFNVITDFAARPPDLGIFTTGRTTLEERAGTWLRQLATEASSPGFTWDRHIAGLAASRTPWRAADLLQGSGRAARAVG